MAKNHKSRNAKLSPANKSLDGVYNRLNPTGDVELVRTDGDEVDGTLSEKLSRIFADYVDNGVQNSKYITDLNECTTTTAGIALMPGVFTNPPTNNKSRNKKRKKNKEIASENDMRNNRVIREWQPPFKAAGYTPGEHEMESPQGKSLSSTSPESSGFEEYDTDTKKIGTAFPGKHNETTAMCDVDDDGVEHEPQGSHESKHGEPDDGFQEKMGHNWPDQPRNSGNGVAEPFDGSRWSDGGTLSGSRKSSSTQSESWDQTKIASLMEDDSINVQELFDSYARSVDVVCLEDFERLCKAHGSDVVLDNASIMRLMSDNNEFMFYEGRDSDGIYWLPEPVTLAEDGLPTHSPHEQYSGIEGDEYDLESDDSLGGGHMGHGPLGHDEFGGDEFGGDEFGGDEFGGLDDDGLDDGLGGGLDSPPGEYGGIEGDEYGDLGLENRECPGCGYIGGEESCPECGESTMSSDDMGVDGGSDIGMHDDHLGAPTHGVGRQPHVPDHRFEESVNRFIASAQRIVSTNKNASPKVVAEALANSWSYHTGNANIKRCSGKTKKIVESIANKYPRLRTLLENEAIEAPSGTKLGGGNGPVLKFAEQPNKMEEKSDKNLLGKKQVNDLEGSPTVPNTGKGMSVSESIKSNLRRLNKHVQSYLTESDAKLARKRPYSVSYSILVAEAKKKEKFDFSKIKNKKKSNKKDDCDEVCKMKTKSRDNLSEALVDAEELLQVTHPSNVALQAIYTNPNGQVIHSQAIPMISIGPRGPLVREGKAVFRFNKHADAFADALVAEGVTCRITPHNWGCAVAAKTNYDVATHAFKLISEYK